MQLTDYIQNLIRRYLHGLDSESDFDDLKQWYQGFEEESLPKISAQEYEKSRKDIYDRLIKEVNTDKSIRKRIFPFYQWAAAAIAIFILGVALYYQYRIRFYQELSTSQLSRLEPVKESVTISYDNGRMILLDSVGNQALHIDGVQRIEDGELIYNTSAVKVVRNTIHTPKGSQFKLTLPDGTKVWMNAFSSLSFPSRFTGDTREVELRGEAYFEVAKNASLPFLVKTEKQVVTVLGTHFNINAYTSANTNQVTLVEGCVSVTQEAESVILSPNQQSSNKENRLVRRNVVASDYIGWRDGYFTFNDASAREVMVQLAHWYDFSIESPENTNKERFSGKFKKDTDLSEIFKILALAGIDFQVVENKAQQRKIILKPQ